MGNDCHDEGPGGEESADDEPLDPTERPDGPPTPSVAFGLLADKRPRFLLYVLHERGGTMTLDELAPHLAVVENDTTSERLTTEMEERVRARLYHADVPKLAECGLVTYDSDSGAVTLTDAGDGLEPYLKFARERERDDVDAFLRRCRRDREE
ncbi:DUF7344 domain-containing protein [Halomicrobium salinisoli]|uniref:DUF7344 domain-containing protein n=1 Tax=Halomicrobium salinisoli TaxID=2878391 RepID=UPI001CF00661|nr:hypothetical protein [Halomicrobium salinisoli]